MKPKKFDVRDFPLEIVRRALETGRPVSRLETVGYCIPALLLIYYTCWSVYRQGYWHWVDALELAAGAGILWLFIYKHRLGGRDRQLLARAKQMVKGKTQYERERCTLAEQAEVAEGRCPDCGESQLMAGPTGGFSTNVQCGDVECGALASTSWARSA